MVPPLLGQRSRPLAFAGGGVLGSSPLKDRLSQLGHPRQDVAHCLCAASRSGAVNPRACAEWRVCASLGLWQHQPHESHSRSPQCGLTLRSRRGPTSIHQARAAGGRIFHRTGLVFCCWSRLSSNVRPHNPALSACCSALAEVLTRGRGIGAEFISSRTRELAQRGAVHPPASGLGERKWNGLYSGCYFFSGSG